MQELPQADALQEQRGDMNGMPKGPCRISNHSTEIDAPGKLLACWQTC